VREQFFMLLIDERATLAAIPELLPDNAQLRAKGLAALSEILSAAGPMVGEVADRFERIAQLFGVVTEAAGIVPAAPTAAGRARGRLSKDPAYVNKKEA
jgi:hypothetical protein